jgi:hypothetical protein
MDLFNSNELILADLIAPEATYSAPDGTLLARIVRMDGMVAKKRKRGNFFKWLITRQNDVGDVGLVSLRVEDVSGRSLLTLCGASGSICEVKDADGKRLGRFEHDNELHNRTWAASLLDRNIEWLHHFRAWAVINPAGETVLEIHTDEIKTRRRNSVNTQFGGDVRTITTPDGTQVAVWTDEKLTLERDLPSPLRELVIATPMAVKTISPDALIGWSKSLDEYVWERP